LHIHYAYSTWSKIQLHPEDVLMHTSRCTHGCSNCTQGVRPQACVIQEGLRQQSTGSEVSFVINKFNYGQTGEAGGTARNLTTVHSKYVKDLINKRI
jgi:hypothetical protein